MNKFEQTAQWKSGSKVADFLDAYYRARGWTIWNTTPYEERKLCLGDRHFVKGERHLLIEYKSGIQTFYTGNVFLETRSVDTADKAGWVYTSQAHFILYACLPNHKILYFTPGLLRQEIAPLIKRYGEKPTNKQQNATYRTWGAPVPLEVAIRELAVKVVELPQ